MKSMALYVESCPDCCLLAFHQVGVPQVELRDAPMALVLSQSSKLTLGLTSCLEEATC